MMQRKTTMINGKKLSFIDAGNPDAPVILFGHSYLWSADMWELQINHFTKEGYRCLVPDLWGHGESQPVVEKNYSIEALAEDYKLFLEKLEIRSVIMVGLSVGGMWGSHLALNNPGLVSALIIIGSHLGSEPERKKARFFSLLDYLLSLQSFTPEYLELVIPFFLSPETIEKNGTLLNQFKSYLMNIPTENINGIVSIGYGIFGRNSILDKASRLSFIPTLVIVGDRDVPRPPQEAKEMAELLGCHCEVIKDAAHIANLEQPEKINEVLGKFFSSLALRINA